MTSRGPRWRHYIPAVLLAAAAWTVGCSTTVWANPGAESFGINTFETQLLANQAGELASQAGSHPYSWTTTILFNTKAPNKAQEETGITVVPDGDPRNVEVELPPGMVANPTATATRCKEAELEATASCPPSSIVGEDFYRLGAAGEKGVGLHESSFVYNMETPPDEPAELGFAVVDGEAIVHIIGKVRTGEDYGFAADVPEIFQGVEFWGDSITICGKTPEVVELHHLRCGKPEGSQRPFLTLPTSCGSPLTAAINAYSWQGESLPKLEEASNEREGIPALVTGCDKLHFTPQLEVQPTTHAANAPTGLNVELSVPQEEGPEGLAEADVRNTVVTLPTGMAVSPVAANGGLGACTPAEIGLRNAEKPSCPRSAKIATAEVETPLLDQPLEGSVYLAQQGSHTFEEEGSNPFGSLIALYLVLEGKGVVVKIPGEVSLDPVTGQLTARFGEDPAVEQVNPTVHEHLLLPEIPFSHLRLTFFGGPRAALVTPPTCGTYTVTSSITPYSAPESGPPATPGSSFEIDERCGGGQLSPSFVAGTEDNQAGEFSALTVRLARPEATEPEQALNRIQVRTPPGLLAMLSQVTLCEEPQAQLGTCGPASMIGHVTVGVGAGTDPLYVGGEVFLTGPYNGAPFGLSIVVPAVAGPFNLGTVVERAAIDIDPHTAAVTVTSEPLPRILDGIPLQIRTVEVSVDRKHFIFNPTNCGPMAIGAAATGVLGASVPLSSRFQAANCATLAFAPKFKVTVSGRSSRVDGTSLDAQVSYPSGAAQANIALAKVELPKQLPARLKTLQKACTAAVFETNPASCPAASVVGIARAATTILPVGLIGPVYFVSHGGEAYPDLVVVLQGDGVRDDLVGATFISKSSITSSTFKSVPDVPVSSFELYLPEGPNSALAANGNLCKSSMKMPTTFVAQNGAEIHSNTPVAVSGCPKARPKKGKARRAARSRTNHRSGR